MTSHRIDTCKDKAGKELFPTSGNDGVHSQHISNCQYFITNQAFVAALFAINLDFGETKLLLAYSSKALSINNIQNINLRNSPQKPHFSIISATSVPDKCRNYYLRMPHKEMLIGHIRHQKPLLAAVTDATSIIQQRYFTIFMDDILSTKFKSYLAVSRLLRLGRW